MGHVDEAGDGISWIGWDENWLDGFGGKIICLEVLEELSLLLRW